MKKYLLILFWTNENEIDDILNKLYENIIRKLESKNFKVKENLDDPDGYLVVKKNEEKFGITTPVFKHDPVMCGIYLERLPGKHLDDEKIIKSIMPFVEYSVDQLSINLTKMWFSTYTEMIKKIN